MKKVLIVIILFLNVSLVHSQKCKKVTIICLAMDTVDVSKEFVATKCNKHKFYISNEKEKKHSSCDSKFTELIEEDNVYYVFEKEDGKKIMEGYWQIEVLGNGYFIHYHLNGVIASEGVYWLGKKIGLWKYFDKQGKLVKTEKFVDENNVLGTEKKYPILTLESN